MSIQIEKLDDGNYDMWSLSMRSLLITSDLWNVVCEKHIKPEEALQAARWETIDQKALASLILNVKPTQLMHIKSCTTSAEAWKKLRSIHMPAGPIRKTQLYQKLVRLKMQSGDIASQYVNSFVNITDKLAELAITLEDELKVIMFLSSLPDSWENFVVAIETRDEMPPFETVKIKFLEEGARKEEKLEEAETVYTYTKQNNSKQKDNRQKDKDKFKGKCYNCQKPGHRASECRNKNKVEKKEKENEQSNFLMHSSVVKDRKNMWCLDSGATSHMCCDKTKFSNISENKTMIMLAADKSVESPGVGTVILHTENRKITMRDVLYVPSLNMNFVSISKAAKYGHHTKFENNGAVICNNSGEIVLRAKQENNLYVYENKFEHNELHISQDSSWVSIWHNRFGHLNFKNLKDLSEKKLVHGLNIKNVNIKTNCDTCNKAKICGLPFPQKAERVTKSVLELVHSDVCGPMNVNSIAGNRYVVSFIDDYTRKNFVYFMRTKNEVFEKFKLFKNYVECQTNKKIKVLRSDNGTEYKNKQFDEFLEKCGIKRQLTVPYTPQQNGIAERANRTLIEMAKSLLIHANLPEFLWAEAVQTAAYLRNRCPTKVLNGGTPFELWKGRRPSVKHLRTFGSRVFALEKPKKGKFQAKGSEYVFVGYSFETKAYRLYDPEKRSVVVRRDVKFLEGEFKSATQNTRIDFATNIIRLEPPVEVLQPEPVNQEIQDTERSDSDEEGEEFVSANDAEEPLEQAENSARYGPGRPRILRTGQRGRPRKQYNVLSYLDSSDDIETPKSVAEALSSQYVRNWQDSMQTEMDALRKNETWEMVDLPPKQKAIASKWVFRIKRNKDGEIERFKSRLVAKGCGQQFGVNYWETFSPVIRYETIRMLFAIAAEKELCMHQVDISNAYLNSTLEETVYMKQPENFVDEDHPTRVLKLQKAIYGLKQSGRSWNNTLDEVLRSLGFKRCKSEPCLYVHLTEQKYIAVYVDDLLIICPTERDIDKIKRKIADKFETHDSGPLKYFLGMEVKRNGERGPVTMSQTKYIESLLATYGMQNCRSASTPLEPGFQVSCQDDDCAKVNTTEYQSLIGSLMYLAVLSRPDILHAVCKLSQRNTNPHVEHQTAAKHILRYLSGTMDLSITYHKTGDSVKGFADADWANDQNDRKSYSGYAFMLGGSAFSWGSSKQSVVAQSSTEAEYIALSTAAKEAVYLRRLLKEIGCLDQDKIVLLGDNISAQHIAKNPVHHKRTKHIDIKYHFVREKVESKEIELKYVSTNENVADIFTKGLGKQRHYELIKYLGLN